MTATPEYTEMEAYFTEKGLTVPILFQRFASDVTRNRDTLAWQLGQQPAEWPFSVTVPHAVDNAAFAQPFTPYFSVRPVLYEPWDDIDDEYGEAVLEMKLVSSDLLLDFRVSERVQVLKGGGNSWGGNHPESDWYPFWNEAMEDFEKYAARNDLLSQFSKSTESVTPSFAVKFDPANRLIITIPIEADAHPLVTTYVDGPPALGEFLLDDEIDAQGAPDGDDDLIDFLDANGLEWPPYVDDFCRFIRRDEIGVGWHLPGGPDFVAMDDYMQNTFIRSLDAGISPQLALNHAGHGINSYGLNLRMQIGPVLLVVQYGWGGVYMDTAETRDQWNAGMAALEDFFTELDPTPDIYAKPVPREIEVAIRFSTFRGSTVLVRDESGDFTKFELPERATLREVLDLALEHQEDTWGLF